MTPANSAVQTTHLVLPSDANALNTAFGGYVVSLMDIAAGICAAKHCRLPVVTAAIDNLVFKRPIRVGDVVSIKAAVNFTGLTSMEVGVRVEREDALTHTKEHCLSGYFTFVAVDRNGKPIPVPPVSPETKEDQRRYQQAQLRRAGRLKDRVEF